MKSCCAKKIETPATKRRRQRRERTQRFSSLFLKLYKNKSLSYFPFYFQSFFLLFTLHPFDMYAFLVQTHAVHSELKLKLKLKWIERMRAKKKKHEMK